MRSGGTMRPGSGVRAAPSGGRGPGCGAARLGKLCREWRRKSRAWVKRWLKLGERLWKGTETTRRGSQGLPGSQPGWTSAVAKTPSPRPGRLLWDAPSDAPRDLWPMYTESRAPQTNPRGTVCPGAFPWDWNPIRLWRLCFFPLLQLCFASLPPSRRSARPSLAGPTHSIPWDAGLLLLGFFGHTSLFLLLLGSRGVVCHLVKALEFLWILVP